MHFLLGVAVERIDKEISWFSKIIQPSMNIWCLTFLSCIYSTWLSSHHWRIQFVHFLLCAVSTWWLVIVWTVSNPVRRNDIHVHDANVPAPIPPPPRARMGWAVTGCSAIHDSQFLFWLRVFIEACIGSLELVATPLSAATLGETSKCRVSSAEVFWWKSIYITKRRELLGIGFSFWKSE